MTRAWFTAVVIALSLVVGVPASPATASDDTLTVRIDALSPSQLSANATIRMSGVITNTGSASWTAVHAYLVIPRSPFQSRTQIETAIEDGQSYTGERVVDTGTFDEVGDVPPGASVPFSISVPVSQAGLAGPGGVYPVGVQILATDSDGDRSNNAVARATSFLPWVSDSTAPVPAGLVWPFTANWSIEDPHHTELVTSVQSGQLRNYLNAAIATPRAGRTIVLDPAMLDELNPLSNQETLPDGVELSAAQTAAVAAWLSDLRTLALDSTTWIVSYARPDELALNRYPENAEALWSRVDNATSEALVAHELTGSRANWPTITGTTSGLLDDIRSRGDGPTLVSRQSVPDWEPRLGSVVNYETLNGPLPLLVNGTLPDTPGAETPATLRQRILTDAALGALSRESDSTSRADALTIIDPSWDPGTAGGAVLARAITSEGSDGLTTPTTAGDLVHASPATYTGEVPDDVDTKSLSAPLLDRVAALSRTADRFADIVVDDNQGGFDRAIASDLSIRWRSAPATVMDRVETELADLTAELEKIAIDSPSTITLSSSRGGFPLTISNDTAHTVRVGLDLEADNPSLDLDDVPAVEIAAGERYTITVEVDLGDQTSSTVTTRLASDSGMTFGEPAVFNIRSSNVGLFVWIAMAAAGLLVVATWARRFLGRRRRHARSPAQVEDFEDTDE